LIHPRERDLVIGTHGRSIYVTNIGPLEELTPKVLAGAAHLFDVRPALAYTPSPVDPANKPKGYVAPNPPVGADIYFYLAKNVDAASLTIANKAGKTVAILEAPKKSGLHRVLWNLRAGGDKAALVPAGDYMVRLDVAGKVLMKPIRVEAMAAAE
jgi:hypothetical protein